MKRTKLGAAGLLLLFAGAANAASISYYLDQSNGDPYLPDGVNYLQVTIADAIYGADANAIRFDVTVLGPLTAIAGPNFGIQTFGFNTTLAVPTVLSSIAGLPAGWSADTNNNLDGFGRFELVNGGTGSSRQNPTLTFYVSGISGDVVTNYAVLSTGNATQGHMMFAAHVAGFLDQDPGDATLNSAFFGGSKPFMPNPVPVPSAVWMFGSSVGLLAWVRRRRRD